MKKRVLEEDAPPKVVTGSRIVDFDILLQNLVCKSCSDKLLLHNLENEKTIGLASILIIRCSTCLALNEVPTSKMTALTSSKQRRYDVNIKNALGINKQFFYDIKYFIYLFCIYKYIYKFF